MSLSKKIRKLLDKLKENEYLDVDKMKIIKELPNSYYKKGRIITQDPKKFLKDLWNENYDPKLLDKFKFHDYILKELDRKILMNLPIEQLIKMRETSKQYKNAIDMLWCDLYERDFKYISENDCYKRYKETYSAWKELTITDKKIDKASKEY